jgi:hypothetical protein
LSQLNLPPRPEERSGRQFVFHTQGRPVARKEDPILAEETSVTTVSVWQNIRRIRGGVKYEKNFVGQHTYPVPEFKVPKSRPVASEMGTITE